MKEETKQKISKSLRGNIPWNKGKHCISRSEKIKKRISETVKKKGVGKWMKGRKLSDAIKQKMSETAKKIGSGKRLLHKKGKEHPSWKGGITSLNKRIRGQIETRLWREAVFARDNWTCQKCGKQGGRLNAHHIKCFKDNLELRLAIDNGQTLCFECHNLTYNYSNNGE